MSARLVFWYEFASTYSYPAAMRIEQLAKAAGVAVEWRPFLLGPVFQQQGWRDSPFNVYPAKGQYMWRDLERLCAAEHLPLRRPSTFPRNGLLAARVALIASDEGWCADFSRAVYRANFADDRDIADATVIGDIIIRAFGRDPASVLERAGASANKERLRAQTEDAMTRGIFGAPSFTVGGELFWGNDRLEQAIAWAKNAAT
jgi:2-hydroxychromene-2-carboxylate isomerase